MNAQTRSGTTGAVVATASWYCQRGRFGAGGYSAASTVNSPTYYVLATGSTSLSISMGLTTIAGAPLIAKPLDTCNTSSGYGPPFYYYVGLPMTGTGGTVFSIFCVDASGAFQWALPWGTNSSIAQCYGCCISDDGYLYVCGASAKV